MEYKKSFKLSETFDLMDVQMQYKILKELNVENLQLVDIHVVVYYETDVEIEDVECDSRVRSVRVIGYRNGKVADVGRCDTFIQWCMEIG